MVTSSSGQRLRRRRCRRRNLFVKGPEQGRLSMSIVGRRLVSLALLITIGTNFGDNGKEEAMDGGDNRSPSQKDQFSSAKLVFTDVSATLNNQGRIRAVDSERSKLIAYTLL